MINLKTINEFKYKLLELDPSMTYEFYENDLLFIIAIDNDKYEKFEKEINKISFNLHSNFEFDKEIVCMPKKFVSSWDIPVKVTDKVDTCYSSLIELKSILVSQINIIDSYIESSKDKNLNTIINNVFDTLKSLDSIYENIKFNLK